ncbi:protein required for normal CLN1 and CLN2 G1 cyclin expression [Vanrija albida]|uniref:Protein required for normal CLN1 and CLN2 G1 cyclin expression n=1 Tax=Vanrija albida TaxID=181172 RepID=A0ABR3PY70_9TREE
MADAEPAGRVITLVHDGEQLDVPLDLLGDTEYEDIAQALKGFNAECPTWTQIAREHWRAGRLNKTEELLVDGIDFFAQARPVDHFALVNLHAMFAHLHLALARTAPKTISPFAKYDVIPAGTRTKDDHYIAATQQLERAEDALRSAGAGPEDEPISVTMAKIILYLARGQPAVAAPFVERLLLRQPNNLAGLTAHARLQFSRRQHDAALVTYQKMLQLNPDMSPDPRIGLGLCAYVLGDKERARAAWTRAHQRDPGAYAPRLLLGLASLNAAREPSFSMADRLAYETEGVAHVQAAFKINNKNTAAALALATITGQAGKVPVASKLAERAIQFSDNKRSTVLSNAERGRLGFIAGDVADAGKFIAAAKAENPQDVNIIAELTLAQIAIKTGNLREALNFVEQTAKRLGGKGPFEFAVLHASLLAYPHLGMPADEQARNRLTARNILSEIQNVFTAATTEEDWAKLRGIASDADTFVELAKLWQDESVEKAITAYQSAISIKADAEELSESQGESQDKPVDYPTVRLSANLASLFSSQGATEVAEERYQEALHLLKDATTKEADQLKTVLAYDLGRTHEQAGDVVKASKWFRDVLHQHPEHVESKVRLAALAASAGRNVEANSLLKECLHADESNISVRSVYTKFLISIGSIKEAYQFAAQTLKIGPDAYTFTALGWLHFTLGREAKSQSEQVDRQKQFLRSAEAYERALSLDPNNAVAAQGLAIALAEDTLTPKALQPAPGPEEAKLRARLATQALTTFGRIKDSLPDGAVNVNIGHCYFIKGEEERAIEAYGAALNSAGGGRKVHILLYLCRAWYSYAIKESNFSAMSQSLYYATKALHILPSDRAILYNIAMIQQKAAEIMVSLDPAKRTLSELQLALKNAQDAVGLFRSLADDKSRPLAYDPDMADQRARYGESLLRKAPEQVEKQEAFEGETAARVEEARRVRAEEQERINAAAAKRQSEIQAKAAELAEQRKAARDEARQWQEEIETRRAEEETRKEKRAEQRKKRKDAGIVDDDEVDGEDGERPRKKKRGGKKKKQRQSDDEDEMDVDDDDAAPTGGEGEEGEELDEAGARRRTLALLKSKKKKQSRRREDPDDDDAGGRGGRGGKQFKSKAIIEDSDDEVEEDAEAAVGNGGGEDAGGSGGEDNAAEDNAAEANASGVQSEDDDE